MQSLGHVVIMIVPREYEGSNNTHRLHRTLKQAAPLRHKWEPLRDLPLAREVPGYRS